MNRLTFDIVTITKTTELFLASSVPNVEFDRATVCVEHKRMHLDTKSGCLGNNIVRWVGKLLAWTNSYVPTYFFSNSPVK